MVLEKNKYLTNEFKACLTLEHCFMERETFRFLDFLFITENFASGMVTVLRNSVAR